MSDQYEIKPLKTLVSAYACAPSLGSEPGVGWNWVRQIARFSEVWVITRENNRETIEASLAQTPMPGVHWIYFDLPLWARFWKKGRRGIHLYYYLWQVGIYRLAKKLHREIEFDLIHHVTFVNYWMPSFLGLLPIPFIWGPVGGGDSTPPNFYGTYSLSGRIFELARGLALRVGERDPFVRMTARSSTLHWQLRHKLRHDWKAWGAGMSAYCRRSHCLRRKSAFSPVYPLQPSSHFDL